MKLWYNRIWGGSSVGRALYERIGYDMGNLVVVSNAEVGGSSPSLPTIKRNL